MEANNGSPVVHLELHTGDLSAARELCAVVCGWGSERITAGGGSYVSLDLGGRVGGGIVECDAGRSLWLPYAEVPSIEAATERARARGATVLLEPSEGPSGWRSVIATAAGAELALWESKCPLSR